MKNSKFLSIVILLGLVVSCTKNIDAPPLVEVSKDSNPIMYSVQSNSCLKSLNGVSFDGNMLVFQSGSQFTDVMQCLSDQVDTYGSDFDSQTNSMTEDQANDYAQSTGFDEDQPLVNFESNLGFYSLRAKLSAATDQWLDNPVLDEANNPDNHVIMDDVLRTLLNPSGKVKVGSQVYDFINPSTSVPDGGFSCYLLGRTSLPPKKYDNGKKQLWIGISLVGIPFAGHSAAKVKGVSYRLARGGRSWEKFRTDLSADLGGDARDGVCDNVVSFANFKNRKKSSKIVCRFFSFQSNNYARFPYWFAKNNDFYGLIQSSNNPAAYLSIPIKMVWY